jgi:hypothetical protein
LLLQAPVVLLLRLSLPGEAFQNTSDECHQTGKLL